MYNIPYSPVKKELINLIQRNNINKFKIYGFRKLKSI